MNENEQLQRLEDELRKTDDIIAYLGYLLMTQKAWKRTTEFRITQLRRFDTSARKEGT